MEYIRKNPECGIVETDEELDNLIDSKMNSKCIEEYPDSTLSQLIEKKEIIIYIGLTFRTLKDEGLRWLTQRGANQMHLHLTEKQTTMNRKSNISK